MAHVDDFRMLVDSVDEGLVIVEMTSEGGVAVSHCNPAGYGLLLGDAEDLSAEGLGAVIGASNLAEYCRLASVEQGSYQLAVSFRGEALRRGGLFAKIAPLAEGRVSIVLWPSSSTKSLGFSVEDVWRVVAENPVDCFSVVDREGRYLYVNRTAVGIRFEDVVGKLTVYDFTDPRDHETVRGAIADAFSDGRIASWEAYVAVVDQWFHFVAGPVTRDGEVYCVCISSKDITQQKRAEIALQESEAQFRSLAENAPNYIVRVDRELKLRYVNRNDGLLKGLVVLGESVENVLAGDDQVSMLVALREVLRTGDPQAYQVNFRTDAGNRVFSCRAGAVRGESCVDGLVIVCTDITEQLALSARMLHASKMASIGELAAGVAHEINNPLMVLSGNTELLRNHLEDSSPADTEARKMLDECESTIARVFKIVDGLRKFSRVGSPDEVFRVHHLLHNTVDLLAGIFGFRGVEFEYFLDAQDDRCKGDPSAFQQVMTNLIANARDAMAHQERARIVLRTRSTADRSIVIEVEDRGTGIDEDRIGQIFDTFFTTKARGEGTGMGLSISRAIVTGMGGRMAVRSSKGEGSCFTVELPTCGEKGGSVPIRKREKSKTLTGTVLLVDDDRGVLEVVCRMLRSCGLTVTTASDGPTGLMHLKTQSFDHVISDRKMPKMSGEQFIARAVARGGHHTRYYLLTGWSEDEEGGAETVVLGGVATRVLRKPIRLANLVEVLKLPRPLHVP